MRTAKTQRLTVTAVLLALSTVLALVSALVPFLHLPMGGNFTLASMLPVVVISYMFGVGWGLFAAFTYSVIQIVMDLCMGLSGSVLLPLFLPQSDDYMGAFAAVSILVLDYFVAYSALGLGGVLRDRVKSKTAALVGGALIAVGVRYLVHVLSGYIFYGAWAEWFFSQEGWFQGFGAWLLARLDGGALALVYSFFYNGLYMIPEVVVTALVAVPISRIARIRREEPLKKGN
ncbi:MAG: energy-coupled thiamine transporter ThiT [Clostridia bacterium]|nr:energy-coupled thiamine transporter ThiT [Clostridia bacterium]